MKLLIFSFVQRRDRDFNYYFAVFCIVIYIVEYKAYNICNILHYFAMFCIFLADILADYIIITTFVKQ